MEKPDFCGMQLQAKDLALFLRAAFQARGTAYSERTDACMPFNRPTPEAATARGIALRHAAVALPVFPVAGRWHVALMKRTEYPGVHSGQVSIPGGEVEPEDINRFDTAIQHDREVPLQFAEVIAFIEGVDDEGGVNIRRDQLIGTFPARCLSF